MIEFTPEEVLELKNNQYVHSVTAKTVRFTIAFKEFFWKEYNAGKTPRSILTNMGLNTEMLGESRIRGIVNHIRDEANSGAGFHEGRQQSHLTTDLSSLPMSKSVSYMQHQIAYMRQELEFIKKLLWQTTPRGGKNDQSAA